MIGSFYARLAARGQTFTQAVTACMRTLLAPMNTPAARRQLGDPSDAT